MNLQTRKRIFLGIMLASYLPIFLFLNYSYLTNLDTAVYFIALLCAMLGVVLLTWQYLMGVRALVSKLVPDLIWVNSLHQKIGMYGFLVIAIHPTFVFIYYLSQGINLAFPITAATRFDQFKDLGEIAFTILSITWFTSAILREKISFRWWKRIHVFNLIILPLVLLHSLTIGTTLIGTNLRYYWYFISVIVILVLLYRFVFFKYFGFNRKPYKVINVHKVLDDVTQVDMSPVSKYITPEPGQFLYFHPLRNKETHPFTISQYNSNTHIISITPKCSGPFSCTIQDTKVGDEIWIDGPYGVFTQEAYTTNRPIVLLIAGIGITPFVRLIEKLQQGWQKQVTLLYGNQNLADVAYADLITATAKVNSQFHVVNIISRDKDYIGEQGHIDMERIKKYVSGNLADYDFFICGPKPMMKGLRKDLESAAVPSNQIYWEKFSL